MKNVYDSREPLKACKYTELDRRLGVQVSQPFLHRGLREERIEINYEIITVNTMMYGVVVPVEEWQSRAYEMTETILAELENVIGELVEHRKRLQRELHLLPLRHSPKPAAKPKAKAKRGPRGTKTKSVRRR